MVPRLKALAELKAAALINCEFCLDIGSTIARAAGVTDTQLSDLPHFRDSDAFDADEKLVLELAEVVTSTPALVSDDLRQRLVDRFTAPAVTELAAAIAWENNRGRLNQALGVRPAGFSRGWRAPCPSRRRLPPYERSAGADKATGDGRQQAAVSRRPQPESSAGAGQPAGGVPEQPSQGPPIRGSPVSPIAGREAVISGGGRLAERAHLVAAWPSVQLRVKTA